MLKQKIIQLFSVTLILTNILSINFSDKSLKHFLSVNILFDYAKNYLKNLTKKLNKIVLKVREREREIEKGK